MPEAWKAPKSAMLAIVRQNLMSVGIAAGEEGGARGCARALRIEWVNRVPWAATSCWVSGMAPSIDVGMSSAMMTTMLGLAAVAAPTQASVSSNAAAHRASPCRILAPRRSTSLPRSLWF